MATPSKMEILYREEKLMGINNLRREIVRRKVSGLKLYRVSVIGDEQTGRHTLLRRFLNMRSGPFQGEENRQVEDTDKRDILVDIGDRPRVIGRNVVNLRATIFNFETLNYDAIFQTIIVANAFAVIFDVGRYSSFRTAVYCMDRIYQSLKLDTPEFILVGNKIDLPHRSVSEVRGHNVAKTCHAAKYYECSAWMNINMDPVFDALLLIALDQFLPFP